MNVSRLKIISNKQVSDRYWHMVVESAAINGTVQPGQFFNIKCQDDLYPFLRRPLSIYRINREQQTIEFLYLVKGAGTQRLTEKVAGDELNVFGPLGKPFMLDVSWDTILLVARGVGIATLAALAKDAAEKNIRSVVILSARSQNDLLAAEMLKEIGAVVYKVTDEDNNSDVDSVRHQMEQLIDQYSIKAVYTCGSKRLSKMIQDMMREYDLPAETALEENMGCGMGVCFACVCDVIDGDNIRTVRVCKEGPVFPLDKVVFS